MYLHLLRTNHVVATWCSLAEWRHASSDPSFKAWLAGFECDETYLYFRLLGLEVSVLV